MTSIIRLQAFSGADGESPPCYLLQVDEFRFLLDCGWDEDFTMTYIDNLKKHLPQINAVLVTYPDQHHLGALPYLVGKCGLNCPVYATIPVYKMGQMFMYDLYQSRHNTEDFDIFTLDDVDAAFDKVMQLKYSQTVGLKGKGHGLQITPLPAGHMIGGTIWKIVKDGEEEIVYAIDYNHKKERHLNGCMLENISRPHLLITDTFNADYSQTRRRQRDEQLLTLIMQTMRNDGNVLITVDTAGRVLELAYLLDQMWRTRESGLMAYSLALLNNVSYNVVEFAKSQVEWMSDKIMRSFEDQRNNPFQFKYLQLCHSLGELAKIPDPKVVLASSPDMQCGFSRDLFIQWCQDSRNSIVITNRTSPGTLSRALIDNIGISSITVEVKKRVRLEGSELEEYLKNEKEKEAEAARIKAEQAKKDAELESSDESDVEADREIPTVGKTKHDLMAKNEGKIRVGFFKQAKKAYPMFPYFEEKIKWDDYGEVIRPEDYIFSDLPGTEEEAMDTSKKTEETSLHGQSVINKRKYIGEIPTKCVSMKQNLNIKANITFIDFEGRSDGESIKKIITQIKPRQLILVHGNLQATMQLADHIQKVPDLIQGSIFVPRLGEVVDCTKESHIFQVKLKDALVSALDFAKAKDTEIAWIDAMIDMSKAKTDTSARYEPEDGEVKEESKDWATEEDEGIDLVPLLVQTNQITGHNAVFLNEPKLSDFKQVLLRAGFQAEFSGGVLVCNNLVAIRRNEAGKMQLEGALCEDYYKIRQLLYDQYAIV